MSPIKSLELSDINDLKFSYRSSWYLLVGAFFAIGTGISLGIVFEYVILPHDWHKILLGMLCGLLFINVVLMIMHLYFVYHGYKAVQTGYEAISKIDQAISAIDENVKKSHKTLKFVFDAEAAMRSMQKNRTRLLDIHYAKKMELASAENRIESVALAISDVSLELAGDEDSFQEIIAENLAQHVAYEYFIPSEKKIRRMIQQIFRSFIIKLEQNGKDIDDQERIKKLFRDIFRVHVVNGVRIMNTCVVINPKDTEPYGWIVPVLQNPELMVRIDEHYHDLICDQMDEWREREEREGKGSFFPEQHPEFIDIWL